MIERVSQLSKLSDAQKSRLKPLSSPNDIQHTCPSNYNLISECFAVLIFNYIPEGSQDAKPLNYMIRIDIGRAAVDVENNNSDYEKVALPVQWAVDRAGMDLMGVQQAKTPREWPYTQLTNEEQRLDRRLCECMV